MLKVDERIACSQAFSVYESLDEESKSKIPTEFVDYLKNHLNENYKFHFISTLPIEDQITSENAMNLINKLVSYI